MTQQQDIPYGFCQCGCGQRTKLAPDSNAGKGWVKGAPLRFLSGHNVCAKHGRPYSPNDYLVNPDTGCWVWQRGIDGKGYGVALATPRHRAGKRAHRVYYEAAKGPIPEGLQLDHLCRNKACVNPDHLEPVTHAENLRRGRHTKLSADDVRKIRELAGTKTRAALGREFHVSAGHISRIVTGYKWK